MMTQEVTLGNNYEKNAARFVDLAGSFESSVSLETTPEKRVNGKSIIGLQSLGVTGGDCVTLLIHGDDQEVAMRRLIEVLED